MPLVLTLASRNLFYDRLRLVATLIGIVFSIVLVTVQIGLYSGFGLMVTTMIDHASADLWIMPQGTKCFEDPSLLDDRKRFRVRAIIGADLRSKGLPPWNLTGGSIESLSMPNAVAVDHTYLDRLGVSGLDATAEIRRQKVKVTALTSGIRSFTTTPYVFMSLDRARAHTGVGTNEATFVLVRISPDADVDNVRRQILATISDVEVLTPAEFSSRSRSFWLFGTGAGAALFAGALLGVIVGTVIVAQTLYSSTKDHLYEFATLRAIGCSNRYIYRVIIWQALLNAVIGFALATAIGYVVVQGDRQERAAD